ncbi:MAG TPA: YhjD/YihY/BrkB family envelope integrity protein [Planctomycetota bacterium]|nr:YhjD/YihY/BrkB family envelope integrity protein [Planctomycetota bacterium]
MKHEFEEHEEAPYQNPLLARVWTYFAKDVWQHDLSQVGFARALYYKTARVLYLATSGFLDDQCLFRASALTYITVLSLVPLLAFAFSMIKGLGAYEGFMAKVRSWLDRWLQSEAQRTGETGDVIRNSLDKVLEFVNQTDVTKLGAAGLVFLLVAVVQMLGTIEGSFNDIWGVKRPRSVVRKLTDYLAMVILAPIFFATAVSLTSIAQADTLSSYVRENLHLGGLLDVLLQFTSVFAMWIFFTFLFMTMPNARTRFASALLGGLVSGLLWHGAQILHVRFQVGMANYNRLYAGFAAIPIFLAWIHVSWVTVLAGAELAFAHQSEPAYRKIARTWPAEHAFQEIVALRAMVRIAKAFLAGERHPDAIQLSTDLGVPPRPVELALSTLSERGLVAIIDERGEQTFLPGRDPGAITIKDVLDAMKGSSGTVPVPCRTEVDYRLDAFVRQLDGEFKNSPANRNLRELAQATE